ncbi:nuclease [Streptomyces exfoliatus]|uniref:Nuclease n=1 Tax=Streptomyces exfoliatus TaxID=1905 RepID=A0ABV3D3I6_STREX
MPMLLIKGSYEIVGTEPDGDNIHFRPDDPDEWDLIGGPRKVKRNAAGRGKLRLEAIDALETHYSRTGPSVSQPLALGHAARDEVLSWVGFTSVTRDPVVVERVTASTPASVPGFILTRGVDISRRAIAFAGRGEPPFASGTQVFVDTGLLETTLNHHLIAEGLVYPLYYRSLFFDLRNAITATVEKARTATPPKGLWAKDATLTGATVTGMTSITTNEVILPKLFRRLVDYFNLGGTPDLSGFPAYLDQEGDRFLILPTGQFTTGLDEVVQVTGTNVKMTRNPWDLVFEDE